MAEAINEMERRLAESNPHAGPNAATTLGETSRETPPHITGTEKNG